MSVAEVGVCTEVMVGVFGLLLSCDLPDGHSGAHHDDATGASWWPGWRRRRWIGRALIALGESLS